MAIDQFCINIAQHTETGEYAVAIKALCDDESIVTTYLDADTARAMARGLAGYANEIDRRNAAATHTAEQAIETMRRG